MGKHRKISPGDIIEKLEILENLGYRKYCGRNTTFWKCRCVRCGKIVEIPQKNLGTAQKDCGCWRNLPRTEIKLGTEFGRLKVIGIGDLIPGRGYMYLCECQCEKHTRLQIRGDRLRSGETTSCGCVHDNLTKEHIKAAHKKNYVGGTSVNKILSKKPQKNNTSGIPGVTWHKRSAKWEARIAYKGTTYHLGYYTDKQEAAKIVEDARKHIMEDFFNWYSVELPELERKGEIMKTFHNESFL